MIDCDDDEGGERRGVDFAVKCRLQAQVAGGFEPDQTWSPNCTE